MPILSQLSRRFYMLTTDAKPDPPRIQIEGHTHNLTSFTQDDKTQGKSKPTASGQVPELECTNVATATKQKSLPNDAIPTNTESTKDEGVEDARPSGTNAGEQKKASAKAKTKSRQYKHSQSANVVNYNIINSNGVKIGARTSYICNVNQYSSNNAASPESSTKPKFRQMPADVERLTSSTEEITMEDIFVVKTHIGRGWRDVARKFSYSDGQIEQFEENYRHRGVDEVIYQLLLDWKQANTKDADIGNLINTLWVCHEYDCAERLVATRKESSYL